MLVKKITFPQDSIFKRIPVRYHYSDSYSIETSYTGVSPEVFGKNFFTGFPAWVDFLLKIRHVLVKPFGLLSDDGNKLHVFQSVQIGNKFSFCKIIDFNSTELLLYAPDKHLDIWLSFFVENKGARQKLTITTVVKFNIFFGRVYFLFIKPFHKLIIISKMKSLSKSDGIHFL
jgi:hypothetical protein